jgi:hypothetical protein
MSISFITPRNIYNFSYPNWDELRTAYIQTFNSFLGDWIDKKKDEYSNGNFQQYTHFQDIVKLDNELMSISDSDYNSFIKLTNKYYNAITCFYFDGINTLINIKRNTTLSNTDIDKIHLITYFINDYFDANLNRTIENLQDFLIHCYKNEINIYIS